MAEKLAEMQELEAAKAKSVVPMERQMTNWDGDTSQSEAESAGGESGSDGAEEETKEVDIEDAPVEVAKEEEAKAVIAPKVLTKQDEQSLREQNYKKNEKFF